MLCFHRNSNKLSASRFKKERSMSAFEISYLSFKVSFGASFIFDVKFFYASRLTAIGALEENRSVCVKCL